MGRAFWAAPPALLLFFLLHTDNLVLKLLALALYALLFGIAALRAGRFRALLLIDLFVTALITALLLVSGATFSYYRWGWLAHALASLTLLIAASGRVRPLAPPRAIYWLLIDGSVITLTGALIFLPPYFTLVDFGLALWTLGALPLISAALIGGDLTLTTAVIRRPLLIGMVVLGVGVSLWSIPAFPNWSATDEAIIVDFVDTYQRTGVIEASMTPYDAPTVTGNLYVYAARLWQTIFPTEPLALRVFSTVGGLALIVVVFAVTRALQDTLTAWIAAALLATNLLWLAAAHIARQESWLAVWVWSAVGLTLVAQRRRSRGLALLSGLVVAFSADVHPLGAYACLALGLWWLVELRRERNLLTWFVIGGAVGAAYYAAVHILPDPARFLQAIHDEAVSYGAEGWTPLAALIQRHAQYVAANPLEFGLLIVGALAGLRYQRGLGVFVGALIALYALTVADPNPYYPLLWITGMAILTALALRQLRSGWRAPLLAAVWALFVLNAVLIGRQVAADWNGQALSAAEQVAAAVPSSGQGMGEAFLYLALRDPTYIGFPFVEFLAAGEGVTRWQAVAALAPGWIVTLRDQAAFAPPFDVMSVSVPNMHLQIPDAALARAYRLVRVVPTSVGDFQIWVKRDVGFALAAR